VRYLAAIPAMTTHVVAAPGVAAPASRPDSRMTPGTTLVAYLLSVARTRFNHLEDGVLHAAPSSDRGGDVQDLVALLSAITLAVKSVGALVRRSGIDGSSDAASALESTAEKAQAELAMLNRKANQIWINALLYSGKTCLLVSEDLDSEIVVEESLRGKYCVVFDPLTGLSDPPALEGAIFGVHHQLTPGTTPTIADVMQPARNLVAAGYALFGSCTVLMFSVGHGLHAFTLDPSLNEFILTEEHVKMPFSGSTYSINEGHTKNYDRETKEMLKCLKVEPALDGSPRTCRYIGSMVADVHRTIVTGGIYLYPPHSGYPNGRLKLLYEAGPLAFLVSQAGGSATTGTHDILDINPTDLHRKVPCFIGSEDDVNFCSGFYRTAPWGRINNDPMFQLRRTLSLDKDGKKKQAAKDDDDDGVRVARCREVRATSTISCCDFSPF
jgi:fructose-1,6-bisphosphatase I